MQRRHGILIVVILTTLFANSYSLAQIPAVLQKKLQRKVSVTWQGQELATALERLANVGQISLWIDRRVDRQQTLEARFEDLSLQQSLEKIAEQHSLGVSTLGKVVYLGPEQAALELTALAKQARKRLKDIPATARRRWLHAESAEWSRLSEPKSLAAEWLKQSRLQLLGSEQIPHDLWPAQSLPPLPLVDRLVLLLVGFDLTCQISPDGNVCEIVPIKRPLTLTRQRPLPPARPRRSQTKATHQRFTLRLQNQPLGPVLDQLATKLQLEIVWAVEQKEQARKQRISCDLKNVEQNELLRSVLASAGLRHQRKGKRITIEALP